jgi:tetratricopeptide (TPR) repeat protein
MKRNYFKHREYVKYQSMARCRSAEDVDRMLYSFGPGRIASLVSLLLVLFFHVGYSQNPTLDSLQHAYGKQLDDTTRCLMLSQIAFQYIRLDQDTAQILSQEAFDCSVSIGYSRGTAEAHLNLEDLSSARGEDSATIYHYTNAANIFRELRLSRLESEALNLLGIHYHRKANYAAAYDYYIRSLKIRREIKSLWGIGSSLNNLASLFKSNGDYSKAQEYFLQALDIYKELNNTRGIAACYNNVAGIYELQGDWETAHDYFKQSLEMSRARGGQMEEAVALNNLGKHYADRGDFEKALKYHRLALDMRLKIRDYYGLVSSYGNLGVVLNGLGRSAEALDYFQKSETVADSIGDHRGLFYASLGRAEVFEKMGDIEKAALYGRKAYGLCEQYGIGSEMPDISKFLFELYEKTGDEVNQLRFLKSYTASRDSIYNIEEANLIARMQSGYELAEKEKTIQLLDQENRLKDRLISQEKKSAWLRLFAILVFATLSLLLTVAVIFWYRNWKRSKNREAIIEKQSDELQQALDLQEQKAVERSQEIIRQSEKLRDYAFYNSHLIRKPLANLLSLTEVWKMDLQPSEREQVLENINRSVIELDKLVRDVQKIIEKED